MTIFVLALPIASEVIDSQGIKTWRWIEIGIWIAITAAYVVIPRQTKAIIDNEGITFRKTDKLLWSDVKQIEIVHQQKFRFTMKWLWGNDQILRFMPKEPDQFQPKNWQQRVNLNRTGSMFSLPGFVTGPPLNVIADECKKFSDVPVLKVNEKLTS